MTGSMGRASRGPLIALPPFPSLHVHEDQLEAVAERPHVRIRDLLQLKALWNDLDRPILKLCVQARLEAKVEEPGELRVDAESVHRAFGVGLRVRGQPPF
jgi:hypothetical protein